MKRTLFTIGALAVGLLLSTPGRICAQVQIAASTDPSAELKALERRYTTALVFGDVKTLAEILDDSYLDTDDEGHQLDKNAFIAAVKGGERKMLSIQLSQLRIRSFLYAAVVTGRAVQKGMVNGQQVPEAASFTDTFAMVNGGWKFIATHRSAPRTSALAAPVAPVAPAPPQAPAAPPAK